ncbi:MAG: VOC family protein [Deltaproteobacteria bacterium]|nr:VOC family protein [Deltaproteobacteria bacterium]
MNVKHLDHLNLSVTDFGATVAWYGRVFGFELVEDGVEDGVRWGVLRGGEAMLCIYEHRDYRPLDRWALKGERLHGVSHFGLRIVDRGAWEATLAREGLTVLYGGAVAWPHSTSWYIKDPTGYEIEVACWDGDVAKFD